MGPLRTLGSSGPARNLFFRRVLPPAPFRGRILLRLVVVWAFLRTAGAAGAVLVGGSFVQGLAPTPASFLWIAAAVAIVVRVEAGRRKEIVFLANLGVSSSDIVRLTVAACLGLDLTVRLLLG